VGRNGIRDTGIKDGTLISSDSFRGQKIKFLRSDNASNRPRGDTGGAEGVCILDYDRGLVLLVEILHHQHRGTLAIMKRARCFGEEMSEQQCLQVNVRKKCRYIVFPSFACSNKNQKWMKERLNSSKK
jgi:hypothetical protein